MHKTLISSALLLLVLPSVGCHKIQARSEFKLGNHYYHEESYAEAMKKFQSGLELDPAATFVWRSVGLSALALYKPGDESPENKNYGTVAIDSFRKYLEDYPEDGKVREYLLTMLVNDKRYEDAIAYLDQRAAQAPQEAGNLQKLKINILLQSGQLDKAWELVKGAPVSADTAEAYYTIAVEAWNKAYNDPTIDPANRARIVDMGLESIDRAVKARAEYFEAMVYYNLLYREKAKLVADEAAKAQLTAKADEWQQKAIALRKKMLAAEAEKPAQS